MILVVGSTGVLGVEVCKCLLDRGEAVRALVRSTSSAEKVAALQNQGAAICVGDLKDPQSLIEACHGVDAIISTASSTFSRQPGDSIATVDEQGQLSLVDAARSAGVDRFLFVSFRVPAGVSFPLADAKAHVERAIAQLDFTILQASFFMESWLSPALGFDYENGTARIYGPGTNPISWVSLHDVAKMCALAIRHPAASRKTIEFGGPEALSPLEVVARFKGVAGREFQVEHVPQQALELQAAQATDPMQKSFTALMLGYSHGDAIDMASVRQQFGIHLTSVSDFARTILRQTIEA